MKRILTLMAGLMFFMSPVHAESFLVEATGYHTVSRNESINIAEDSAVNDALKFCCEQVGVRISAYSKVINKVLAEDTVERFSSSVVKIREKNLSKRIVNDEIQVVAHVKAIVNTDDLEKWEPPDVAMRKQLEEDKKRLYAENLVLREENERLVFKNEKLSTGTLGNSASQRSVVQETIAQAQKLMDQKKWQEAARFLTQQISIDTESSEIYYQRGICYLKQSEYKSALRDFQQAFRITPVAKYAKKAGDCYYYLEDYHRAVIEYNNAISIEPNYGSAYCNRACAYWSLHGVEIATADLNKAIELGGTRALEIRAIMSPVSGTRYKYRKQLGTKLPLDGG